MFHTNSPNTINFQLVKLRYRAGNSLINAYECFQLFLRPQPADAHLKNGTHNNICKVDDDEGFQNLGRRKDLQIEYKFVSARTLIGFYHRINTIKLKSGEVIPPKKGSTFDKFDYGAQSQSWSLFNRDRTGLFTFAR